MIADRRSWEKQIEGAIHESLAAKERLLAEVPLIGRIAEHFVETIRQGGTIFFFGNGGSAADAQHLAAELIGRFSVNRRSLPALALTVNTSNLTAIANDYGYEQVFSRQLEGLLRKGDLVVAISTSGDSPNVLEGVRVAREKDCTTVAFTGGNGGKLKDKVDVCFIAPASSAARIQEVHILVGHVLCQITEEVFCGIEEVAK